MRNNTFSVIFYLNRWKSKHKEKQMIYARITICKQICQFSTNHRIRPELWDAKAHRATGNSIEAIEINAFLDQLKAKISLSYTTRLHSSQAISPYILKQELLGRINEHSMLLTFFRDFNGTRRKQIGYGLAQSTHNKYVPLAATSYPFFRLGRWGTN